MLMFSFPLIDHDVFLQREIKYALVFVTGFFFFLVKKLKKNHLWGLVMHVFPR